MTIVCIKDNIVAADSSTFQERIKHRCVEKKIVRSPDGALGAAGGPSGLTRLFRQTFSNSEAAYRQRTQHAVADKDSGFEAVWLEPNGEIWRMYWDGKPYLVRSPAALGAPFEMAIGAMFAGASAEEAVRICVENHDSAGGDVQVETL
jgi:hypothetical protein